MKALTVRQPWASLIVAGIKDVENRPRPIRYRGKLAIHAGLQVNDEGMETFGHLIKGSLPLGAVIGSVDVVDCVSDSDSPWALSDYYHWILANPRRLQRPVYVSGKLGLWDFQR
jgi:ASCH domain